MRKLTQIIRGLLSEMVFLGCPVWQWPGHEAETEIETSEPFAENESFKPGVEE